MEVQGDQVEFADLLGVEGILRLHGTDKAEELNWFNPNRGWGTLCLARRRVVESANEVKVFTELGNTFTFRLLDSKKES